MKEKWKNLLFAIMASVIVTCIFVAFFSYPGYQAMTLDPQEMQGMSGETEDPMADMILFFFSVVSIAVFCICTVLFFFAIRYLKKWKTTK